MLTDTPKIIAMFRLKNEAKFISKSFNAASQICDEIVVLDDDSIDNTLEICEKFDTVVDIHHQTNLPFDEMRDKNTLLLMALKRKPDFIISLDGDQLIQSHARKILFEDIMILHPTADIFEIQQLNMWDKPNQFRYDGASSAIWIKKLLRISNKTKNLRYEPTIHNGNMHCPALPQNSLLTENSVRSRIKIFHYGKYTDSLRQEKFRRYNEMDPNSMEHDKYIHLISGQGKRSGPNGIECEIIPDGSFDNSIS